MASIVIKVKYEQTLRRFNVTTNEDQKLDLSLEGLRLKISSLFNLPSDADISLTYEDEDDDMITLGDDEDLHDMVRQGLNPVRITVHRNSGQSAQSSSAPSSGSAAPSTPSAPNVQPNNHSNVAEVLKSVQEPLTQVLLNLRSQTANSQSTNPDVAKIVKSVQEPLAHALTKLSLDMSSKAASTTPMLADLFDGLSKLGQSYLNAAHSNAGASSVSSHDEVGNVTQPNSNGQKPEGSVDKGVKYGDIDTTGPTQPAPWTQGYDDYTYRLNPSVSSDKGKKASCESSSNKTSRGEKEKRIEVAEKGFQSFGVPVPVAECPFSGTLLARKSCFKQSYSSNRSFNKADSLGSLFHKGVRCDGCGVTPITGPRFKSKVKYDYDLCSICFSRIGNNMHYTRIDFPLAFKAPDPKSLRPYLANPHVSKHLRSRLDSRFIADVNVMDGTAMAPSTPFTKIWRMRNNGTLPWNRGLRLLWIGGDRFSSSDSVEMQVPFSGVDVGNELDIAVDFIAPELPGRYISYWRMAEPSGHKFGQRVWVQIQVDSSVDLTRESSPMLNLNLPPDSNEETVFPWVADVKAEPGFSIEVGESSAPSSLEQSQKIEMAGLNFPINDDLLVTGDSLSPSSAAAASPSAAPAAVAERPVSPIAASPASYPEVDANSYHAPEASAPPAKYPTIDGNSSPDNLKQGSENTEVQKADVEEKLLKELEQMGFKQFNLNKEVLQKNEYDLGRSVDDLCGVFDWDPILDELKEMGFEDKETNQKLLAKNNGSITRVVMDLISEEKA